MNQTNLVQVNEGSKMDPNLWFNILYKVKVNSRDNHDIFNTIPHGKVVPYPVNMEMTLDQFLEAEEKLRTSNKFLELEAHKLESPQYDAESVRRINDFALVFGGSKTKTMPQATTDMGFGEIHFTIYTHKNQNGIITVKNSTRNKYANQIGLYCFTESGFKRTIEELSLPI